MAFQDPVRESYLLLTFTQNGASTLLTDWTEPVGSYSPAPWLQIDLPPNVGTLDEKPLTIQFPIGASSFLDGFVSGDFQAPVKLRVQERARSIGPIDTTGCAGQSQAITYGSSFRLVRGFRTASGAAGRGKLEFVSVKRVRIPLGIPSTPRCAWTLGDKSCQIAITEETGTVASISRKTLTLTDPTDSAVVTGRPTKYWHRGYIRIGEAVIGIRDWTNNSYSFELIREPPAAWLSQVVTLRPGCDKTLATCQSRWSNEANFGGMGIATPKRQVVLETST